MKERKATEEREKGKGEKVVIFKKEVLGWGMTEYQETLSYTTLFPKKKKSEE